MNFCNHLPNILTTCFLIFSVQQSYFNLQGTKPYADDIELRCAYKCMKTYGCRASEIKQDENGNYDCTILNDTQNIMAQPVIIREYPTPTTEGTNFLNFHFAPIIVLLNAF